MMLIKCIFYLMNTNYYEYEYGYDLFDLKRL